MPNPWGSPGDPDHQATVRQLRRQAEDEFPDQTTYLIRENKSIRRFLPGHVNRRPDVSVVNKLTGLVEKVYEAARTEADGTTFKLLQAARA